MRIVALVLLATLTAAVVALAWRAWDPPAHQYDPATAQVVSELRYQNCLLRHVAGLLGESEYEQRLRGLGENVPIDCKRP
jgi:hypothetical protein